MSDFDDAYAMRYLEKETVDEFEYDDSPFTGLILGMLLAIGFWALFMLGIYLVVK